MLSLLLQGPRGAGWHPNGLVLVMLLLLLHGATGAGWHPNGLVLVMLLLLLQGAAGAGWHSSRTSVLLPYVQIPTRLWWLPLPQNTRVSVSVCKHYSCIMNVKVCLLVFL